MSNASPLNDKASCLVIPNQLCPHYLLTDGFLDLLPFVPSEFSYSDWFYHVPNLWIIFSQRSNFFGEFYLVNALSWTPEAIQSILKSEPSHCGFTKTLKGVLLTLKKDKTLRQLSNRSEWRLTCRHLQKTSHRQADDQFLPISEGQISDLCSTNLVKQTVSQDCLWKDLSRSGTLS